jgi:hypothetical protein
MDSKGRSQLILVIFPFRKKRKEKVRTVRITKSVVGAVMRTKLIL